MLPINEFQERSERCEEKRRKKEDIRKENRKLKK
jgi:hypothetical protein